jgi:hypothetical protein
MTKPPHRPKRLDGHRYWRFEPDLVLTSMKHRNPKKLLSMQKNLIAVMPTEGIEISHEERVALHPMLRDRLPAGSRREDFIRVAESLEHARQLSEAGLHGAQFYPAVIDTSQFTKDHRLGDVHSFRAFLDVPGEERRLIMPTTYVMPKMDGNYFIEAYGMQHADNRETMPHGLHRTFDVAAPVLGLALTSALLRKTGAGIIGLPGQDLQWARKGTKRPQSLKALRGYASSEYQLPETREALQEIIDHWDQWGGAKIRQKLSDIPGQSFIAESGIPKVLLNRNYRRMPETLGAIPITARDALGPTAIPHMMMEWGHPEPETLLDHRAYDLNLEKLDAIYPFLKPMTKKEVVDWKQKMNHNGHHDLDNILALP